MEQKLDQLVILPISYRNEPRYPVISYTYMVRPPALSDQQVLSILAQATRRTGPDTAVRSWNTCGLPCHEMDIDKSATGDLRDGGKPSSVEQICSKDSKSQMRAEVV